MKLFYTPKSPYASICRIIASQAGLSDQLELGAVKLRTQDNPVIPLSPMGRIPVLVDGNLILSEARHICAYLDENGSGAPSVAPYSAWQAVADEAETLAFLDAVIVWSREVRREAGLRGLYRGVVPRVAKISAGQGVVFLVYEQLVGLSHALVGGVDDADDDRGRKAKAGKHDGGRLMMVAGRRVARGSRCVI